MAKNVGYLTSNRTKEGDEVYTPYYAVAPIIKYLPKDKTIWCPFDEEWSAFYQTLKQNGYNVIRSSIQEEQDFFTYEPDEWDIIVSNPPFSIKDDIIERIYSFNKPFALLLPVATLQSKKRFIQFVKGLELLCFDARVDFHTNGNMVNYTKGNHFSSAYFCSGLLPEKLIFEELRKYEKPLVEFTETHDKKEE